MFAHHTTRGGHKHLLLQYLGHGNSDRSIYALVNCCLSGGTYEFAQVEAAWPHGTDYRAAAAVTRWALGESTFAMNVRLTRQRPASASSPSRTRPSASYRMRTRTSLSLRTLAGLRQRTPMARSYSPLSGRPFRGLLRVWKRGGACCPSRHRTCPASAAARA